MKLHDFINFLSLSLTPMTIAAASAVIYAFGNRAMSAFRKIPTSSQHTQISEQEWFVLGIVIGFVGGWIDNFYWGIAWSADYFNWTIRDSLFHNGVYSNLPFRQGLGIIAALCHIAFVFWMRDHVKSDKIKFILVMGLITSIIFAIVLWIFKP